jgi:hypothetical protein
MGYQHGCQSLQWDTCLVMWSKIRCRWGSVQLCCTGAEGSEVWHGVERIFFTNFLCQVFLLTVRQMTDCHSLDRSVTTLTYLILLAVKLLSRGKICLPPVNLSTDRQICLTVDRTGKSFQWVWASEVWDGFTRKSFCRFSVGPVTDLSVNVPDRLTDLSRGELYHPLTDCY